MAYTVKDWKDKPDPSTPVSAAALEDLETRLSGYTDTEIAAITSLVEAGATWKGVWSGATTYNLGDGVQGSDGHNYISTAGTNLNHNPTTDDGSHWSDLITGAARWLVPTAVKTSAYAAAAADFVPVDISSGSVTVTLPVAPVDKTRIGVKVVKISGTPGSTTCTISRAGSDVFNIAAGSTSLTLTALFQGVLLQYKASSGIWYVSTADTPLGVALGAAKLGTDGTVGGPSGSALVGSVEITSSAGVFGAQSHGGIQSNVVVDQAPAINAWLRTLPYGSKAVFGTNVLATDKTQYFIASAVELPPGIDIEGTDSAKVMFSAMAGYADSQLVRNWQSTDGTGFNPPAAIAAPVPYPKVRHIGLDLNGASNCTCLALTNIGERAEIQDITTYANATSGPTGGSGNTGLAVFSCNTSSPTVGRFLCDHIVGYGYGWKNWIFADGTNNGGTTGWIADLEITNITTPINPSGVTAPTTTACSDSPLYFKAVDGLRVTGHQELLPSNTVNDAAMVRLIDCGRVCFESYFFEAGGHTSTRPAVRATSTGTAPNYRVVDAPRLHNCRFYKSGTGWGSRSDACTITGGSATVTDASVVAGDLYRPVYGPGIPSGAYVSAVSAGVSFTLSVAVAAFIGAGVSATLEMGTNIIEDETEGKTRHWRYHATYFDPIIIYDYTGASIRWKQGPVTAPDTRYMESFTNDYRRRMFDSALVSCTWPYGRRAGSSGQNAALSTGRLAVIMLPLYPGDVVTNLIGVAGGTALAGGTHQWAALFSPAKEQLGISADDTSNAWGGTTDKQFTLTAPFTASLPAPYYWGLMIAAGTTPTLVAQSAGSAGDNPSVPTETATFNWTSDTGLTTPSTCPPVFGSLSGQSFHPLAFVT